MDIWFTLYCGSIETDDDGGIDRHIDTQSGECRITCTDGNIEDKKEIIHAMLDIAIDRAKQNRLAKGEA